MDSCQLLAQRQAIESQLQSLTDVVNSYFETFDRYHPSTDLKAVGHLSKSQVMMVEGVKQMQSAIYGPLNMVMLHYEECLRSSAFRTLVEMGVLERLPVDGSEIAVEQLAKDLKVEQNLLVRLMRVAIPTFFHEPRPEVYTHTPNSKIFLKPAIKANFKMMYDEICTASVKLPEFLKRTGYKNPTSRSNNPYTYAHNTQGLSIFDYILQDAERFQNFNEAMQARSAQTSLPYDLFPFKDRLSKAVTTESSVLLVDVGGGNGQATFAIRDNCRAISGEMVIQDQEQVIQGISYALPDGVTAMAYDFFTPQPIKGALFYYIHRCLHDWPDADCLVILKNLAKAMTPGVSRLLISEIVMPRGGVDIQTAWSDINMLIFGGIERNETQWRELLDRAGLQILGIHGADGGLWFRVLEVSHK